MSSINNLKQIGLAFHNYAAAYNHFPSPALLGGEQKKYPYSWRVALLPFISISRCSTISIASTSPGTAPIIEN